MALPGDPTLYQLVCDPTSGGCGYIGNDFGPGDERRCPECSGDYAVAVTEDNVSVLVTSDMREAFLRRRPAFR